jgi:hypothetical protein
MKVWAWAMPGSVLRARMAVVVTEKQSGDRGHLVGGEQPEVRSDRQSGHVGGSRRRVTSVADDVAPKQPGPWQLIAILVRFIVRAIRYDRQQLDADVPSMIPITKRSTRLCEMAAEFAAARRTDPAAVAALRAAAGSHRKDLRRAAARFRFDGSAQESRDAYLANELLLAAVTNQPAKPITAEQEDWFFRLDAFLDEWGAHEFAAFTSLEPPLADLERTIVAETQAALENPTDDERERAIEEVRAHLRQALRPLVGPEADSVDPVLRTHIAFDLAHSHLAQSLY